MATFNDFVYWAFLAIISGGVIFAAKSLLDLNIKIAVIIEKISNHESRIENLEHSSKRGD